VWIGSSESLTTLTVAYNDSTNSWFNNDGSTTRNAKVQFELIEF